MSHMTRRARVALMLCIAASVAFATESVHLDGRIIDIADGDTITLLDANRTQHKIRLAGIDAPERGQPGGYRSKESLAALVYEQPVRIERHRRDGLKPIVGKVWVASPDSPCRGKLDCPMTLDAGLEQIKIGRAWSFRRYADEQTPEDRARYESAEQEAREKKLGLWRGGTAMPPWKWRTHLLRRIEAF